MNDNSGVRPLEDVTVSFWEQLQQDRGARAYLRRCRTATEVAFSPAFHRLRRTLERNDHSPYWPRLAALVGVLAHTEQNDPTRTVGAQLASGTGDAATLSGLRFRRLVASSEPDELLRGWVRAVRLTKGRMNVGGLATTLLYWGDRVRRELAGSFYDTNPNED